MKMRCSVAATLSFVLLLPAVVSANTDPGGPIDAAAAAIVAQNHLAYRGAANAYRISNMRIIRADAPAMALCYFYDLSPAGYVAVSADAALPPIVAYSFTSPSPCDLVPGTPLVDLLTWDLQRRFTYADLLPEDVADNIRVSWATMLGPPPICPDRRYEQWPPAGSTPTGGWLETNWSQGAPYNDLCPMDLVAGQRSVAGCPAVAMAQILNYNARLNATHFDDGDDYYHNYGGNRFWIDDAYVARGFPSFPQLNDHLDTLFADYFYGTTPSDTCNAALVFACGVAARQVYSSSGSGTFGVGQALDAFQKFGCDSAELLDDDDDDLYERLTQNMIAAHPAHLAVVNPGWTYGHNLVVDGYNTDGYYHLNFGWGGSYNGWYIVPSGLPMNLTVLEGVIVDIMVTPCASLDCTCDGFVDWQDFVYYEDCLSGPATPFAPPGCTAFDIDADADVDLHDFTEFQVGFEK